MGNENSVGSLYAKKDKTKNLIIEENETYAQMGEDWNKKKQIDNSQ